MDMQRGKPDGKLSMLGAWIERGGERENADARGSERGCAGLEACKRRGRERKAPAWATGRRRGDGKGSKKRR